MPAPGSNKRVKGISIHRPFVYGSVARPIDPAKRPANLPAEHTHQWTVWVKGVDDDDISYWLRKVQFKLHETYANPLRLCDAPPFEVTETGWGEFEIQIKLHFVPESGEKPQTLWHPLKLHPYGPDAEIEREERRPIISQNYEEVVFNEPVDAFYDILTGGGDKGKGGASGKGGSKQSAGRKGEASGRTAEVPRNKSAGNPYSEATEGEELDRMKIAIKKVEEMVKVEREKLTGREKVLEELRKTEGTIIKKK
ncbi:NuA4 histone H4 acetyltransferase complex and the SWR1 complex subunit [Trichoglossum hirsutum]|uniref:Protein AF-9 homolog n=1 Tax=Trichoglossum hirsutum TaxID=265104 RepID=A0A9P8LAC9_9PEZI|nr:NuA4 histone H4 acetyltransferase complex and the SWR1 complex subunit [Trichoglossum hirsutum]